MEGMTCPGLSCCNAGASENTAIIEMIAEAESPEEAARLGRRHQRCQPAAVRPDWDQAKLQVMLAALRAKVSLSTLCVMRLTGLTLLHWAGLAQGA